MTQFEVIEYKRRNELHVENKPFVLESDLREGDCLIFFQTKQAQIVRNVVFCLT